METDTYAEMTAGNLALEEFVPDSSLDYSRKNIVFRFVKRTFDIVVSCLALIVLSPLFLATAIAIKLDDGGPVFFSQLRAGKDGRDFRFYKFRSMRPDAEKLFEKMQEQNEQTGNAFKIKNDPRITRVGHFIRKYSIDELPQLVNIIKGDMSIVGPRPALPREVAQYGPYEYQRLYVQPGLTCYWQIQPQRNSLSFEQWLELDLRYIEDRSFLTDWKIILKTVRAVLNGEGE